MYTYESSVYRGDWEDGKRHGWGEYKHNDGSSYVGEYMTGKKHGYGVCTFSDGAVYDGEWRNGVMTGPATYTYADGMIFRGQFKDNKKCGKGVYLYPDDSFYQGELINGVHKHGMVIDEPIDGCHYVGCLDNGDRHGLGIYFYPGGATATGRFGNSLFNESTEQITHIESESQNEGPEYCERTVDGTETRYFEMNRVRGGFSLQDSLDGDDFSWVSTRDIYKGEWKRNCRHGRGEFIKRDDYKYTGEYFEDMRHGEGEIVYFHPPEGTSTASTATPLFIMNDNDSDIMNDSYVERLSWAVASYMGEWKDDKEDGQGMKVYVNGSMYEGEFMAGIEHGKGVFKDTVNGSVYDGDWVQGKRHGQATFRLKDGQTYVGEYRNDVKHGRGIYTALDGMTFDVEFKNDDICGKGLFRPPKEVDPHYFEECDDSRVEGDMLLTLRDGSGYAGMTKSGQRHGKGSYEFSNGSLYEGEFCKGVIEGQGTYVSNIGSVYRGYFKKGKKHGEGEWTGTDGLTYVGSFKNDLMDGNGVRKTADGAVYDGNNVLFAETYWNACSSSFIS